MINKGPKKNPPQQLITGKQVFLAFIPVFLLKSISVFLVVLKYTLLLFIIKLLIGFAFGFVDKPEAYSLVPYLIFFDYELMEFVKKSIPTRIMGFELSRIVLIAIASLSFFIIKRYAFHAWDYSENLDFTGKYNIWKHYKKIEAAATGSSTAHDESLNKLKKVKLKKAKKNRGELLSILGEVQRGLDSMKKDLTFLSIDIVDSTNMKKEQDPLAIEVDFFEYKNLVTKIIDDNDCMKSAWTPDGVMCCFDSADNSVKAAIQVLSELKTFNKSVKTIKMDFVVRCGINSGNVAYDENLPTEEMCDRVIDIAGHFQKYASPNSIYISKNTYNEIRGRGSFNKSDKIIDEQEVYVYE